MGCSSIHLAHLFSEILYTQEVAPSTLYIRQIRRMAGSLVSHGLAETLQCVSSSDSVLLFTSGMTGKQIVIQRIILKNKRNKFQSKLQI